MTSMYLALLLRRMRALPGALPVSGRSDLQNDQMTVSPTNVQCTPILAHQQMVVKQVNLSPST